MRDALGAEPDRGRAVLTPPRPPRAREDTSGEGPEAVLEEIDFFIEQGLLDTARELLEGQLGRTPDDPALLERRREIDARAAPGAQSGARVVPHKPAPLRATGPEAPPGRRAPLAEGIEIAGKYRLERLLREGGMGSVWVATHLALGTPVAIKFMAARLGHDAAGSSEPGVQERARFEREAKTAAQIRMTNVVQVLDYGVDQGMPYLVMELLEGEDLGARLERVGRLSLADSARILTPIARALQRAHDAGLIHRDLKPENIFLATEGDQETPKILDFGVAKALRGDDRKLEDTTSEGTVVGTPYYLSPEQAVGRSDIDHRSDLWSLGVIAFRMVTGRRPFHSEVLLEAVVEICSAPIPTARSVAPDLPAAADDFFDRALAREPDRRFASAREMADAFSTLADTEIGAPARRRRVLALAGAVILGLGAIWWAWARPPDVRNVGADTPTPSRSDPTASAQVPGAESPSDASSAAASATASAGRPSSSTMPVQRPVSTPRPSTQRRRNVGY